MKSFFRRSRQVDQPSIVNSPEQIPINPNSDILNLSTPTRNLRPTQFQPNRIATLYITPSDRDLYLTAMSQLDQPPVPLPLWSEPPPMLPQVNVSNNEGAVTGLSDGIYWPRSPKLVTSPQIQPQGGLMVRDEFRNQTPPRATQHALLCLSLPAGLRFTSFPANVLCDVHDNVRISWPFGIASVSEPLEMLREKIVSGDGDRIIPSWKMELEGQAWKRKGHEELASIRLMIALLSVLGSHGWTLADSLHAGMAKSDSHNLLFSYSLETTETPPLFFAITMPLPDRISIISPPPKATPALISAVRNAILAPINPAPIHNHIERSGTAQTVATSTTGVTSSQAHSKHVSWSDPRDHVPVSKGVKDEGWVNKGVYRFHLNGMRKWLGGGLKAKLFQNLTPHILLAIINSLSSLHYALVASLPLLPISKGRDILIFASLPSSGLKLKDAFVLDGRGVASTINHRTNLTTTRQLSRPSESEAASQRVEARNVDPQRRVLPWTSDEIAPKHSAGVAGLGENKSSKSPSRTSSIQQDPRYTGSANQVSIAPPSTSHSRPQSLDSARPLMRTTTPSAKPGSSSVQSSPRPRGLLLKKQSLRRRSASGNGGAGSLRRPGQSTQSSMTGALSEDTPYYLGQQEARQDFENGHVPPSERWSLVDAPQAAGPAGVIPPDPHSDIEHSTSKRDTVGTSETGHSMYVDADEEDRPASEVPDLNAPQTIQDDTFSAGALSYHEPSGSRPSDLDDTLRAPPIGDDKMDGSLSIPAQLATSLEPTSTLPLKEGSSPRRGEIVDVGSGIGIQSVHGSLGYLPSTFSGRISHGGVGVIPHPEEGSTLAKDQETYGKMGLGPTPIPQSGQETGKQRLGDGDQRYLAGPSRTTGDESIPNVTPSTLKVQSETPKATGKGQIHRRVPAPSLTDEKTDKKGKSRNGSARTRFKLF